MKKRMLILGLVALGVAAGLGYWFYRSETQTEDGTLRAYGNVEIREVNLAFRVGGRVEAVNVEEGDPVEAGALVAQLDAEPLRRQQRAAEAGVQAAEANLDKLQNGFRPEELAQAKAQVEQREAILRNAERAYERQKSMQASGATSQQAFDQAVAQYDEAKAAVTLAEANLDLIEAGYRQEDIAAAQAQLEQARAKLEQIELDLQDTQLHAPSRGTVLVRALEPGSMASAGQTVLTLSLQDRTWVRAYVSEPDLGQIHPGMAVQVYTDARAEPYTGKIGFIASRAEFTPKNVETEELRTDLVFRFRVVLDQPDDALRQGMPVTVVLHP